MSLLNNQEKKRLLFLFFLVFLNVGFEILSISTLIPLINLIVINSSDFYSDISFLRNKSLDEILVIFSLLAVFVFFIKSLVVYYYNYTQLNYSKNVNLRIKQELFQNYLFKDLQFFFGSSKNIGFIIRNLSLVNIISNTISTYLTLIVETIIFFSLIIYVLYLDFSSSILLSLAFSLIFYFIFVFTKKKLFNLSEYRQRLDGEINKKIIETFNWIKTIKIYSKENYIVNNLNKLNYNFFNTFFKTELIQQLPKILIEFFVILYFCLFIITMTYFLGYEANQIVALLAVYAAIVFRLLPSFTRINAALQRLKTYEPNIILIAEEYKPQDFLKIIKNKKYVNDFRKFELKNISFEFKNKEIFVLNNFNFLIKKNEIIGVQGESGSGKTTLINIICGLLKIDKGEIFINDKNLNQENDQIKIGLVTQDSQIFDDTLWNNVTLFDEKNDSNFKKFIDVLKKTNLNIFLKNPEKFEDVILGERGSQISGGQAQRINIARALYFNADLLIFDECTSNLDHENESNIINMIYNLKKEKTLIIISHNNVNLDRCDRVYNLNI